MDEPVQGVSQPSTIPTSTPQVSPKSPLKKVVKVVITVVLLGLIVGGGYAAYTFLLPSPTTQKQTSGTVVPRTDQNEVSTTHFVGSQTINLSDESGGTSSGTATRDTTQANISILVNATLPELSGEQFYQAWVENADGHILSIGKLSQNQDGSFSLESNYPIDPSATFTFSVMYNNLVVTFESTDDNLIETRILEGVFTE
jgi:hypothetical protein